VGQGSGVASTIGFALIAGMFAHCNQCAQAFGEDRFE
jgi:hypothetical protein